MGSLGTILQADNMYTVDKARYEAAKEVQTATNRREAATASLADFSRSLGNTLRVEAAGKEFNEAVSSLAGALESRTTGRINSSLAAAERIGALNAEASAMGVGGSSIDLLTDTIKLQRNIEQDLQRQATARMATSGGRSNAAIMDNGYTSIDLTQRFGNFDHTRHVAPVKMKNRLATLIGAGVATFFLGPDAGQAVAQVAVGGWQASNGNFAGAAQSFDSGLSSAILGVKSLNDRAGQSWFGAVTQKQKEQADIQAAKDQQINWGGFSGDGDIFGSGFGGGWDFSTE